ncbi:MAG: TVP38/TMEM64 family protein [Erysipelotrichaceae bacterium]|nr:TVP38/TMEM64 family protein [Erysipelotrichaceae bacterium]
MNKNKKLLKSLLRLLPGLLILFAIITISYLILRHFGLTNLSKEEIQNLINKGGIYSYLIFILISFLQVTFIPIPGAITILAGNYVFGFLESLIFSFIGMFLGSIFAFILGRTIGRKYVNWAFGGKDQVDKYLEKLKGKESVLLFFMFLLPFFPDDALCSLAGITNIKSFTFVLIQLITKPISIFATLLFMSGTIIPFEGIGLVIIILVGILSIILFVFSYKNAEKINKYIENLSSKLTKLLKRQKDE